MINKSAAIIIKNRSVLYLRKRGLLFYILPGGKIEKGETETESLEREMMEELRTRITIGEKIAVVRGKTFNKSLDRLESIRMVLYRTRTKDPLKPSREIFDKTYIKYKNIHQYLLTPVGIATIELLHERGLID